MVFNNNHFKIYSTNIKIGLFNCKIYNPLISLRSKNYFESSLLALVFINLYINNPNSDNNAFYKY